MASIPHISPGRLSTHRHMPHRVPRTGHGHTGPLLVFQYGPYRNYWLAATSTFTGFMMQILLRGWLVNDLSGSPFLVSLAMAALMTPMLALALFAGVLADRMNRKSLTLIAEGVTFIAFAALAVLVIAEVVQVWHVIVLSLLNGIAFAVSAPARQSLVPSLVPSRHIGIAVSLVATVFSVAQIAGPALGGLLIDAFGPKQAFVVSAMFPLPAMLLYARMRPRRTSGRLKQPGSMLANVRVGLSYIRASRSMRWLMISTLVVILAVMPWQAMMPVFVTDVLKLGAGALGALSMAVGIGALMGSLSVAVVGGKLGYNRLSMASAALAVATVAGFAMSETLALSIALAAIIGFGTSMFMTASMTQLQVTAPDTLRGRVNAVRFLIIGTQPVGMMTLGALAETLGPQVALASVALAGGAAFALLAVMMHAIGEPPTRAVPPATRRRPA